MASWLRIVCGYMKRHSEGVGWEDDVGNTVLGQLKEVRQRLETDDPVRGVWKVQVKSTL